MALETTYTNLRKNLSGFLDKVADDQETLVVRRKGARDIALVPASELSGLIETACLLRSPRNARRLLAALGRAERGKIRPGSVAAFAARVPGWLGTVNAPPTSNPSSVRGCAWGSEPNAIWSKQ